MDSLVMQSESLISNEPLISVVMTSFNHREYIGQAIESILSQDYTNFELIIVDDNSTDGSQLLISEYAGKDNRIRAIFRDENFGSYVLNTNFATSFAKSDYLVLAQCDDYVEACQLHKLYSARKANPSCRIVFSASTMIDQNGKIINTDYNIRSRMFKRCISKSGIISKQQAFRLFLNECFIPNLSAAMIDRTLFESVGGLSTSYKVLADWDFWLKCSRLSDIYYILTPLNNFRQHETTIRKTIKIETQLKEMYYMFGQYKDSLDCRYRIQLYNSVANIFWGFVLPLTPSNYLSALRLIFQSYKFYIFEPVYIIISLIKRFVLKCVHIFR